MVMNRSGLLLANLWGLIAVQVITGLCILCGFHLGTIHPDSLFPMFFVLNLPAFLLSAGSRRPASAKLFNMGFILIMGLIAANFLRAGLMAGLMSGGIGNICGMLHVLSAQSLWLAYPAYRASRV